MVVSGRIVTPPDRRSAEERENKRVAAANGDTPTVRDDLDTEKSPK